jgi:DNA-binding ferritin-like protein
MLTTTEPNTDLAGATAARVLQRVLPRVIALGVGAQHVGWDVTGTEAAPLRDLSRQLAVDADSWANRIATRALSLGYTVDARIPTVAAAGSRYPTIRLDERAAAAYLTRLLDAIGTATAEALEAIDSRDETSRRVAVVVRSGAQTYRRLLASHADPPLVQADRRV